MNWRCLALLVVIMGASGSGPLVAGEGSPGTFSCPSRSSSHTRLTPQFCHIEACGDLKNHPLSGKIQRQVV